MFLHIHEVIISAIIKLFVKVMACLQNVLFLLLQTKTTETDFLVRFPVSASAVKRMSGNPAQGIYFVAKISGGNLNLW